MMHMIQKTKCFIKVDLPFCMHMVIVDSESEQHAIKQVHIGMFNIIQYEKKIL